MEVTRAWKKNLKRGPKMVNGLVATVYIVELNNDKVKRRVYEDWTKKRSQKSVPLVVKVKEQYILVTINEINTGLSEAERQFSEFLKLIA